MKTTIMATLAGAFALATLHAAEIGKAAPSFTAKDLKGESVSLADQKGKVVVLEWVNYECPFVKRHYKSGNMQKLQAEYGAKGVVWIAVNSSAKGKQGYLEPLKMAEVVESKGDKSTYYIQDTDGKIGRAYAAKTTPQMFIINKEGTLVYDGAIDAQPNPKSDNLDPADKLFANALDAVLAGKEVTNAKNKPYGCGVKY